jgi:transcriptional regulator with XRE-family HTH domain
MFTSAYEQVIAAVVRLRKDAGLTQRQLAERLGREQSFVGRLETGQRRLDLVEFVWICRACDADPAAEVATLPLID